MKIPDSCHEWETKMKEDKDSNKILDNLKKDVCIDASVTDSFFALLAKKGNPKSSSESEEDAYNVVKEHSEEFTVKGQTLPEDMFRVLFRIEYVTDLRYRIPDELDKQGINHNKIEELTDEDLLSLTNEYKGSVYLGNPLKIVWITDFEEIEPIINDIDTACDRLGLKIPKNENRCIICSYDRDDINESCLGNQDARRRLRSRMGQSN